MIFQLFYSRQIFKDFDKIPSQDLLKIQTVIKSLKSNPWPTGVKKLSGLANSYRVRKGDYRIIYAIDDQSKTITIQFVRHRKNVYRDLN